MSRSMSAALVGDLDAYAVRMPSSAREARDPTRAAAARVVGTRGGRMRLDGGFRGACDEERKKIPIASMQRRVDALYSV